MIEDVVLDQDAVFRVGRVVSVDGRRVRIAVDKLKNGSHLLYRGGLIRNIAVSSYVKIVKGFVELIAKVDGEVVQEDRGVAAMYRRGVRFFVPPTRCESRWLHRRWTIQAWHP